MKIFPTIFALGIALCSTMANGNSILSSIPDTLKKWAPWVLLDEEKRLCPTDHRAKNHYCAEPAILRLDITEQGATFQITWNIYQKTRVPLPGGANHWPLDVKSNNKPIPIHNSAGDPGITLEKGQHTIEGTFTWEKLPSNLKIPATIGQISIILNGKSIENPTRDAKSNLNLAKYQASDSQNEDLQSSHSAKVHRYLKDDNPFTVTTHIEIKVSGKAREIPLPGTLLEGPFNLIKTKSSLPLRIAPSGVPQVLAKPGTWSIYLTETSANNTVKLKLDELLPGTDSEVWVFEGISRYRQVKVINRSTIDSRDTALPSSWKKHPAYLMKQGETFELEILKTGDENPAKNQIDLVREIWLDFDGGGFTVKDHLTGKMNQDFRLNVTPPYDLGRVNIRNEDQFITKDATGKDGVEIRNRSINIKAEARLSQGSSELPLGWDHDMHSFSTSINMPPGWRIWWATGADTFTGSWVERWTLFDCFLVFMIAISVFKLWGTIYGVVALLTLILTWHIGGAPQWIWMFVLLGKTLSIAIQQHRFQWVLGIYRVFTFVCFVAITIPFLVDLVRHSLHPQIELGNQHFGQGDRFRSNSYNDFNQERDEEEDGFGGEFADEAAPPMPEQMNEAPKMMQKKSKPRGKILSMPFSKRYSGSAGRVQQQKTSNTQIQNMVADLKVQTGTGLPKWQWKTYRMTWDGPVSKSESIRFFMTPPLFNRLLGFITFFGWLVIVLMLLEIKVSKKGPKITNPSDYSWLKRVFLVIPLLLLPWDQAKAQDFPPEKLLNDLRFQLLKAPECSPRCAFLEKALLDIKDREARLHLTVHTESSLYFPLPPQSQSFFIKEVRSNNTMRKFFRGGPRGGLSLHLKPGVHHIEITAHLKGEEANIHFPMDPQFIEVRTKAWDVSGIEAGKLINRNLTLYSLLKVPGQKSAAEYESVRLAPIYSIHRVIHFGLDWTMQTDVIKLGGKDTVSTTKVNLMPGESIISQGMVVEGQTTSVSFARGEDHKSYSSTLKIKPSMVLTASTTKLQSESWTLVPSPLWHLKFEGPMPIVPNSNAFQPAWRPWPGDTLKLELTRPKGSSGQTMTIDRSHLSVRPGKRLIEGTLKFDLKSSRGGRHTIGFPANTELVSLEIDAKKQSAQLKDGSLNFPVNPGSQKIAVSWRQNEHISPYFKTPVFDLKHPSINHSIKVDAPSRWILWVGGPPMGPAVLFWGEFIVLLFISIILAQVKFIPLKAYHWVLLTLGTGNIHFIFSMILIMWFVGVGLKSVHGERLKPGPYNLIQICLVAFSLITVVVIYQTIATGLLSSPNMGITGMGSGQEQLKWFQDRAPESLQSAWVISFPMIVYRLAMLA